MKQTHHVDKIQPFFNAISSATFGNLCAFKRQIRSSPEGNYTEVQASTITWT
jgi:hypothetical protein